MNYTIPKLASGLVALAAVMLLLVAPAHAQKEPVPTGQVTFVNHPQSGTVMVRVVGYGKNKEAAIRQAEKSVFHALLYSGLPGSEKPDAFIPANKQAEVKATHSTYLGNLMKDQGYKNFMMTSTMTSELTKVPKRKYKQLTMNVQVNLDAFRKDLEANGLIRKFGF